MRVKIKIESIGRLAILILLSLQSGLFADNAKFFESKVLPLLKSKCYKCHSHESGKMKGGLTLDSRTGWEQGGSTGRAVIPGNAEKSLLIKSVRRLDEDLEMPPKKPLTDEEIQILVKWVNDGAYDPRKVDESKMVQAPDTEWWSLRPIKKPTVPKIAGVENPIDAFVLAKLKEKGLKPSEQADRRVLMRRLMDSLHGLPPTPEALAKFINDPDKNAYEKLVDSLLSSPRYGERWARHWLDTVHFADSHGCEHDVFRPNAWPFRDYVINSFNSDVSWSRFIKEQLAADYFFPDEAQLTPALGFISAGPLETSRAGTAPITFDYLDRDDMVSQTMMAFNSTTASCARCHDHKFDPVSQEDYYALQAVFAGVGKGEIEYDLDQKIAQKRSKWQRYSKAVKKNDPQVLNEPEVVALVRQGKEKIEDNTYVWQQLQSTQYKSEHGQQFNVQEDGSILVSGNTPEKDIYTISGDLKFARLGSFRLTVMPHASLPKQGPGRCGNGNLHLSEIELQVLEPGASQSISLKVHKAAADWNQEGWHINHTLDKKTESAWGIFPKVGQQHSAVFELEKPYILKPGSKVSVVLKQLHGGSHVIGRFKLEFTEAFNMDFFLPQEILAVIRTPENTRNAQQKAVLNSYLFKGIVEKELAQLPPTSKVYGASSLWSHAKKMEEPIKPKIVHVLKRGDIDKPGKVAIPGAISSLKNLPDRFELDPNANEAQRRAALADWLAHKDNPLTWRSIVNRVWHYHFGKGICKSTNDFGRMGSEPSHPELLDWLAVWFRDEAKGSLKELHKLIVTSETFKQISKVDSSDKGISVDQANSLLYRMNQKRLDAETFRDSVLQISGRLDLTMGGPGIKQFVERKGPQATPSLNYYE